MTGKKLSDKIIQLLQEKKAKDIVLLDLRNLSDVADYFIITSGESDSHVRTLATHVEKEMRDEGVRILHKEGMERLTWVLLDYIDVVVHVFKPETRNYYDLERLWADAKRSDIVDEGPIAILSENPK